MKSSQIRQKKQQTKSNKQTNKLLHIEPLPTSKNVYQISWSSSLKKGPRSNYRSSYVRTCTLSHLGKRQSSSLWSAVSWRRQIVVSGKRGSEGSRLDMTSSQKRRKLISLGTRKIKKKKRKDKQGNGVKLEPRLGKDGVSDRNRQRINRKRIYFIRDQGSYYNFLGFCVRR